MTLRRPVGLALRVALVAAGGLVLAAGGARAQEAGAPEEPPPAEAVSPSDAAGSGGPEPEDGDFRWLRFSVRGRALVRAQTTRLEGTSESDLTAENARLTLRWRPARWLRGELEYDVAENRRLRDAFLQARGESLSVRAGQFKPPVSPIEMDSRWDLPVSERGLLSDVLRDVMGIAGRRPGLETVIGGGGDLTVLGGVFRASSVRGDRLGDEAFDNFSRDWGPDALKYTARLALKRRRLVLGLSGDLRPAEPLPGEGYRHFWTASADLTWTSRRRAGWRVWAEGFVGSSWQDASAFDDEDATFLAGRVIGAWRHGGRRRGDFYVEPYAMGSLFDPDASVRDDLLWEATGGVNVGRWDRLRVSLEAQRRGVGRNAPLSLGLFSFRTAPPFARTRLVLQLGGAF